MHNQPRNQRGKMDRESINANNELLIQIKRAGKENNKSRLFFSMIAVITLPT